MATRQRPADRGIERGHDLVASLGREFRNARRGLGLSQRVVAQHAGISVGWVALFEQGRLKNPGLVTVACAFAVVGLELSARAFASMADAARDAAHGRLLVRFAKELHASLRWSLEVPLPRPGDQRAWDAMIVAANRSWRYGVEAETHPSDGQALTRRLTLKQRDGQVDGVILVLPDTGTTRAFLREFGQLLAQDFPVPGSLALQRLAAGEKPGGSAIVVV